MNETILSFISLHCDEVLLGEVLKKSSFIRDESIPKVSEEFVLCFRVMWLNICRRNIRSLRRIRSTQIHFMIEIIRNRLISY